MDRGFHSFRSTTGRLNEAELPARRLAKVWQLEARYASGGASTAAKPR